MRKTKFLKEGGLNNLRISKAEHKALLSVLFYDKTDQKSPTGDPVYQPKQFPFDKLLDAASAAKKLAEGSELNENKITYKEGEIELTSAETIVVKELFDANRDNWDVTVASAVMELKDLFEGK